MLFVQRRRFWLQGRWTWIPSILSRDVRTTCPRNQVRATEQFYSHMFLYLPCKVTKMIAQLLKCWGDFIFFFNWARLELQYL